MSRTLSRVAVALLAVAATLAASVPVAAAPVPVAAAPVPVAAAPVPVAAAAQGLSIGARYALLGRDRTSVVLVGSYSCGPFPGGVPDRGVLDLEVRQVVGAIEVKAIGYLEPTRCDGAAQPYAATLTTVAGNLRRGAATWSASGYVEGGGGMQNVHVPPTPIRIR